MEDKRITLNIILGVADNEIVVVEELGPGSVCLYTMEYVSPVSSARRTISFISSISSAMGTALYTCLPAFNAAIAISPWRFL